MSKRILVVDDELRIAFLVSTRLMSHGYEVITATSGEEAVLKTRQLKPDAIISDIMMPGMDGGDFARAVAEAPETAGIPILFLSALVQEPDLVSHAALHQYFLPKPFVPATLLEALEQILGGEPQV